MSAQCQPVVLAANQANPIDLVVDGGFVYWINWGDGAVRRVLSTGTGQVQDLTVGAGNPHGLALGGGYLYWTSYTGGQVNRVPMAGGKAETLAQNRSRPSTALVSGSLVYWCDSCETGTACGKLATYDLTTSSVAADQAAPGPFDLALGGQYLYWVDQSVGTVNRQKIGTTSVEQLASGQARPRVIAVDTANVYWLNASTGGQTGSVMKLGLGSPPGTPVSLASNQWLSAIPKGHALALDGTTLYWANHGDPGLGANGSVMRVSVSGGVPQLFAANQHGPRAVAVDSTSVYWVNFSAEFQTDGVVLRKAK